jgi:hypothetical protein
VKADRVEHARGFSVRRKVERDHPKVLVRPALEKRGVVVAAVGEAVQVENVAADVSGRTVFNHPQRKSGRVGEHEFSAACSRE